MAALLPTAASGSRRRQLSRSLLCAPSPPPPPRQPTEDKDIEEIQSPTAAVTAVAPPSAYSSAVSVASSLGFTVAAQLAGATPTSAHQAHAEKNTTAAVAAAGEGGRSTSGVRPAGVPSTRPGLAATSLPPRPSFASASGAAFSGWSAADEQRAIKEAEDEEQAMHDGLTAQVFIDAQPLVRHQDRVDKRSRAAAGGRGRASSAKGAQARSATRPPTAVVETPRPPSRTSEEIQADFSLKMHQILARPKEGIEMTRPPTGPPSSVDPRQPNERMVAVAHSSASSVARPAGAASFKGPTPAREDSMPPLQSMRSAQVPRGGLSLGQALEYSTQAAPAPATRFTAPLHSTGPWAHPSVARGHRQPATPNPCARDLIASTLAEHGQTMGGSTLPANHRHAFQPDLVGYRPTMHCLPVTPQPFAPQQQQQQQYQQHQYQQPPQQQAPPLPFGSSFAPAPPWSHSEWSHQPPQARHPSSVTLVQTWQPPQPANYEPIPTQTMYSDAPAAFAQAMQAHSLYQPNQPAAAAAFHPTPLPQSMPMLTPQREQAQPVPEVRSYRSDATLQGSSKLDKFFGLPSPDRPTPKEKKRKSTSDQATIGTPTKKPRAAASAKKKKGATMWDVLDADMETTAPTKRETMAEEAPASSAAPSAAIDPAAIAQFRSQFSAPSSLLFHNIGVRHLKQKADMVDLSAPSSLGPFRHCLSSARVYTIAVLHQDLSTNFRKDTNEQRKYLRGLRGTPKRETTDQKGLVGGVRPPLAIVISFFQTIHEEAATTAEGDTSNQSDAAAAAAERREVNPHPYVVNKQVNLSKVGSFFLPMPKPARLVPTASQPQDGVVEHHWRLRTLFLELLHTPPPHLHLVVFGAKSIICALMVHFRISSLTTKSLTQLTDVKLAAWMCDPDDNHQAQLGLDKLLAAYNLRPPGDHRVAAIATNPGPNDVDVFLQDMTDALVLLDRLAVWLQSQRLLTPFRCQEQALLVVLINMQIAGVAIDADRIEEELTKFNRTVSDKSAAILRLVGRPIDVTSSAQLANVLYDERKVPKPNITDRGRSEAKQKTHPTTNQSALKSIALNPNIDETSRRIAQGVLEHRKLFKMQTGYMIPFLQSKLPTDSLLLSPSIQQDRIYPSVQQASTGTGRLSYRHPNLQSMPKATEVTHSHGGGRGGAGGGSGEEQKAADEEEELEADEEAEEEDAAGGPGESPLLVGGVESDAVPLQLPSNVNLRSALVPTDSRVVLAMERDRRTVWSEEMGRIMYPSEESLAEVAPTDEHRLLMSADYSQQEVRILAQLCEDRNLIQTFQPTAEEASGPGDESVGDVYRRMASVMFHHRLSDVTAAERSISKTIVLGLMYGMGAAALAGKLSKFKGRPVDIKEANEYTRKFNEQFPAIYKFIAQLKADGQRDGFVYTLGGRRRYLLDLCSTSGVKKARAERQATNTSIQGSAADMCKLAMIRIHQELQDQADLRATVRIALQLHDEIILELPKRLAGRVAQLLRVGMEAIIQPAHVPFPINIKCGDQLGAMTPIDDDHTKGATTEGTGGPV